MIATQRQRTTAQKTRAWYSSTALTLAVSISVLSTPAGAQSSKGSPSSIIAGPFQVASPGGSLRGESMLATGSLSIPIPAPYGGGAFDMQRRTSAGPFGFGTTFMPTVTGTSLDTGSEVLTFTQGNSPYRPLGDKTTLVQKDGGYLLSNPDQGVAFFGQRTSSGAYAISYSEGLNKVRTTFTYSPGSAVPSRISLNNGETVVSVSSDGRGLITSMSVDGSVTSYQYTTSGASTLLSEVKVDGTSILKLTWERDLPVSATDGYGQRTLFAYATQFNNPNEAVLSGISSPDGSISTFSYKGLITDVDVSGVAYRYQWGFNPVTGRSYPKIVERGNRTISITKVDPFSGRLLATEDEFGRSTTYTWDSKGSAWPLQVSLPDGTKVTNVLDGNGDLISSTETSSTGFVTVHSFSYDQLRRVTSQSSKDSSATSSRTKQLTYSGDRRVPDTVKESETRRIDFSPRGLIVSASARGATSTLAMKNGGRELLLSRNGVPTTYSTNASPAGARTTSMTSPFVRTSSFVDTFGRSQSFTTSVLGRIPGSSPRSLANALDSGLITNAFAQTNDASWLPVASTNRTRSGQQGNYVWNTTTTTTGGTRNETATANFNAASGQCSVGQTCQYAPAVSNSPAPQPSVAPTVSAVPTTRPAPPLPTKAPTQLPYTPPQQPTARPTLKPQPTGSTDCCPPGDSQCCRQRFGTTQCRACAPGIY
jgi:hypothetical protein